MKGLRDELAGRVAAASGAMVHCNDGPTGRKFARLIVHSVLVQFMRDHELELKPGEGIRLRRIRKKPGGVIEVEMVVPRKLADRIDRGW